ncbi:PQQ-binding-like beta-propeller repeat protein [Actinoplanes xinjiangensis]|uniref:outer membrane protein assembly factor BamB family protein n=1 Tax=Actinoplanes xinjiangensis TaxID=512350 RepID=UPI00343AEB30
MSVSVIDLGDVSSLPDEPEGYPGGRPGFGRVRVGRLAKAAIAAVVTLVAGGSALPGPPVLREVWSVPTSADESMTLDADSVYLHRPGENGTELTAYDLRTGRVRWTRPIDTGPSWFGATPQHGVLLLPGDEQTIEVKSPDGGMMGYSYSGSLTALDPATGEQLWQRPGSQHWADTGETLLMYERDRTGTLTWLRQVRMRDGSIVWERRAPAKADTVEVLFDDGTPNRIVTAGPRGRLTVLRYTDGTEVTSRSLPWQKVSYNTGVGSSLGAVKGRLVVVDTGLEGNIDRSRVTVYRADSLTPLWSRETNGWANVQDCGPLVCLSTAQGLFEAVDPETGARRWAMAGSPFIGTVADGERLLIPGTDDEPEQTLVDAATGRVIGPIAAGGLMSMDDEEGTATLLRQLDPTTSVLSRIDTDTGRSTVLGVLPAGDQVFCSGSGRRIVCTLGDRLVVMTAG